MTVARGGGVAVPEITDTVGAPRSVRGVDGADPTSVSCGTPIDDSVTGDAVSRGPIPPGDNTACASAVVPGCPACNVLFTDPLSNSCIGERTNAPSTGTSFW